MTRAEHETRLAEIVSQLPTAVVGTIFWGALNSGLPPEAVTVGLERALEFQQANAWRCAGCHRWILRGEPFLPLACVLAATEEIVIHAFCSRCEAKTGEDAAAIRRAVQSYVWEG